MASFAATVALAHDDWLLLAVKLLMSSQKLNTVVCNVEVLDLAVRVSILAA